MSLLTMNEVQVIKGNYKENDPEGKRIHFKLAAGFKSSRVKIIVNIWSKSREINFGSS